MQSRRDQVQAYFFVVGRLVAGVTHGRPDVLVTPNRRTATGTVLGLLLAGLIVAVSGILGLFWPTGNSSWQVPGAIVMDSDSGARYLYLDGRLRPVLNYASARLASGNQNAMISASARSLAGAAVGQPIGIPGAPDAVPAADRLDGGPWTVCVGQTGGAATSAPLVSVLFARPPGSALSDDQALVVSTPEGVRYLVWQGQRHRLPDPTALAVLGFGRVTPVPVTTSWLNPIPPGRDLSVPSTPGAGGVGPVVGGRPTRIGQVLEQRDLTLGTDQFYLVRTDGVAPLSRTSAALVLASSTTAAAYPGAVPGPVPVGAAAVAALPVSQGADLVDGLPGSPPRAVVPPDGAVPCVRYTPTPQGPPAAVPEVRPATDVTSGMVPMARHSSGATADTVSAPAGTGALVRASPAPADTTFLVTDNGTRYPLVGDDVLSRFGYPPTAAVAMSGPLLDLLPTGPPLSTAAALQDSSP